MDEWEKKKQICVMIKPDLYEKLGKVAEETGRTRSGLAGWLLQKGLEKMKTETALHEKDLISS